LAPEDGVRWLHGRDAVRAYASSAGRVRSFCATCSSVAPSLWGDRVLVPAGNLLGALGPVRAEHAFVGSKAPWHVIADAWPRHEVAPPGWPAPAARPAPEVLEDAVHGSCLCGAVTFAASGQPARWLQCHCSRCRRARSAAHGSNTFYPAAQISWISGRDLVASYRPPEAQRFAVSFCTECGGAAPVERDNVPFVLVPAGLFDSDPGARPEAHIHVASQAPWYSFADALPRFAELPPA
jgi:hypothetical protein